MKTLHEHSDNKLPSVNENMEESFEEVALSYPCLITVEKDIYTPRLPSYLNLRKTKNRPITTLTLSDLSDSDENNYGLSGSPTQVEKIFEPQSDVDQVIWDNSETDCAQIIYDYLVSEKYVEGV